MRFRKQQPFRPLMPSPRPRRVGIFIFGQKIMMLFRSVCILALFNLSVSAFAQDNAPARRQDLGFTLSPEIVSRILSPKNVARIVDVRKVESFVSSSVAANGKEEGYVVIGVDLTIEGDFAFEGMWHGEFLLARKLDGDWKSAVRFSLPPTITFTHLSHYSPPEFEEFLQQYQMPNQPSKPTPAKGQSG